MANNKNKKEEKFQKIVEEVEIEEKIYDDESLEITYSDDKFDLVTEIKGIKILMGVSICITIISLLISLIVLYKVSDYNKVYNGSSDDESVNSDSDIGNEKIEYDTSMFTEISVEDFMDMYEENKKYFVYTGRSTCGYCVAFLPYLQQSVSEYDYTLYYLDIDKLTKDDFNDIAELDDDFAATIGATPMVYVIKNKNLVDVNEGYTEYSSYSDFLEDNGVKKRK